MAHDGQQWEQHRCGLRFGAFAAALLCCVVRALLTRLPRRSAAPERAHGAPPAGGADRVPLVPVQTSSGDWVALPLDAQSDDPLCVPLRHGGRLLRAAARRRGA